MSGLSLHVENYKAIRQADVELADLTVLAGVNASGKSTIARLFHRLVCIEANYERYAVQVATERFVGQVLEPLRKAVKRADTRLYKSLRLIADRIFQESSKDFGQTLNGVRHEIDELYQLPSTQKVLSDLRLLEALDRREMLPWQKRYKVSDLGVRRWIEQSLEEAKSSYDEMMSRGEGSVAMFLAVPFPGDSFDVLEAMLFRSKETVLRFTDSNVTVCDSSHPTLPFKPIFSPRQSLYIARPAVDFPSVSPTKVVLNGIEYERPRQKAGLSDLRLEELMGGSVNLPDDTTDDVSGDQWLFTLGGQGQIPISQCADGMKSMSALLMLDKCGLLQPESDSLLIIDEPEVHLHPQWVVEMARILVHLAKRRKVRVLVTTHSPDMVYALRDFVENESFGSNARFYLAKESETQKGQFDYENLGMNIGPIFTVFNQAKDKIASISKALREGDAM